MPQLFFFLLFFTFSFSWVNFIFERLPSQSQGLRGIVFSKFYHNWVHLPFFFLLSKIMYIFPFCLFFAFSLWSPEKIIPQEWEDSGPQVEGTQLRQYVNFILGLSYLFWYFMTLCHSSIQLIGIRVRVCHSSQRVCFGPFPKFVAST